MKNASLEETEKQKQKKIEEGDRRENGEKEQQEIE